MQNKFTKNAGLKMLIKKYQKIFRIPENLNFYSEKDYPREHYYSTRLLQLRVLWVGLITGPTVDSLDARLLLQDLFVTEAEILPDPENEQLNIRVHSASRPAASRALAQLFEHLNKAGVKYPGTEMRLVYELGGYTSCNYAEGVR